MIGTIIAGVVSAAGALYGAYKSSKANQAASDKVAQQKADNKAWYDNKMAEDYTARTDAQAAIQRARDIYAEQAKNVRGIAAVGGASDEQAALAKEQASEGVANATAQVAAGASAEKDAAENQYLNRDAAFTGQQIAAGQQQSQNIAQAAGQVANAAGSIGIALDGTKAPAVAGVQNEKKTK